MTTKSTKPVTRETSAYVRDRGLRPIVATMVDSFLEMRPKGLRTSEVVDIGACYSMALKQRLAREKAERKAARKGKR